VGIWVSVGLGELVIVAEGRGIGEGDGVLVGGKDGMAVSVGGSVEVAVRFSVGVEVGMTLLSGTRATPTSPRQ
jgi:hypothetical protein